MRHRFPILNELPTFFAFWTAVILFLPWTAKAASAFHIEGTASYTEYGTDGAALSSSKGRLVTDFSKWKIQYFDDQNKTEEETTFDGRLTYTLFANFPMAGSSIDTNKPLPAEVFIANGGYRLDADVAGVDTSTQPASLFISARAAWSSLLACGLIPTPAAPVIPLWLRVASPEVTAYKSRIISGPDCCSQIEFLTSRALWSAAKEKSLSLEIDSDIPKDEFVEARFRVLSRTNIEGKCVPLESELVRFWYPKVQTNTGKAVRSLIRTAVSDYRISSETISPPTLSKKTYVSDTRFKAPDVPNLVVQYALTNQKWADEGDPRLTRWVQESKTNYLRMQKHMDERRRRRLSSHPF